MIDFVHLHVHSDFSLQDGAVSVMKLADKAEKLGMTHLALTDHGNMFGAMEFIEACEETINEQEQHEKRKKPVKPIIGCEVYVSPGSRFEKKGSESENRYYHLVLLAMNREGYLNLVKLCSFAYTEGFYYKPRIDDDLLRQNHSGLIALSACVSGEIPRLIQAGKPDEAREKACYYRDLFGNDEMGNPNFYLEIQDHNIPSEKLRGGLSQKEINKIITGIAGETGIPLVATNDVHYLDREDFIAHDILLCIGTGKVRAEEKRKRYHGQEFYLKSGEEMAVLFPDQGEAIANTVKIAARCTADVPKVTAGDLHQYLPDFEIPPGFDNAGLYLRHLVSGGLEARYKNEKADVGKWQRIIERSEFELGTIIKMGFSGYFLIVSDFINWAKENNIPVGPGRGSGAGSIVAYALRITDIDPLKYGLLFERFLNPERISMPDFDIDFANEGRDEVIKYVTGKYGRERVCQIITFGTLGAKAVIKDVARVLEISIPESDMITKLIPDRIPNVKVITLKKAFEAEARLREMEEDSRYTELFSLARKLEGLNRHSSLHASGVVIGKTELYNLVPLYKDPKTDAVATQFDMTHLEKCGLVKMDFLGLKTLDVIKHTEELIRSRGGEYEAFKVDSVPEDDKATFAMLSEGKSFEVFQFESDGMQDTLKKARPGRIEDLIALNALYRPGPMANIPRYVDCKNGRQKISYPDSSLEVVLKETYGVITYQEQVLQVAQIIAGYSLGQADVLRKAMGKKIKEILDKEKIPFLEGAIKQGFPREKAGEIFDMLVPFADYGFNKSHAAGYAVLAYRTAYLKANFPAEFMAASLSNEIYSADKDKLSQCIAEAGKMGLAVDPPDINRSLKLFSIAGGRLVFGFLGIKGLGESPAGEIVACRRLASGEQQDYKDFMDFLNRVDIKTVGKSVIEKLIQTGAFDNLGTRRETLLGNFERAVDYVNSIKDEKKFGQGSLFGDSDETGYPAFEFEQFPITPREDKLKTEKELLGFYFSGHPMDEYKEIWKSLVRVDLGSSENQALAAKTKSSAFLVGLIKNIKMITTKSGEKMAFASLEDFNGEIELTFFSGPWEKCRNKIENDKVAILKGKIDFQADRNKKSFIVDEFLTADEAELAVKKTEAQAQKWSAYEAVFKHGGDLRLLDPGSLAKAEDGTYTAVGLLKSVRTHIDRKGNEMAFATLENPGGEIDLVFFSGAWEKCKKFAESDEILALKVTVESGRKGKGTKPGLVVTGIGDLERLLKSADKKEAEYSGGSSISDSGGYSGGEIHVRLAENAAENPRSLYSLKECIIECMEGNGTSFQVYIHVPLSGKETVIRAGGKNSGIAPLMAGAQGETASASMSTSIEGLALNIAKCPAVADVWQA